MTTPESQLRPRIKETLVYQFDYDICFGDESLRRVIDKINRNHDELISVTQDLYGTYTVFYGRLVRG